MDREDIESRRAENQFWNGAENYQLRADFQMYRPDGEADLYFNTIIGLVYRLYDYERLRPLFNTFQSQTSGAFYTDLFWLGLEGVAFRRTVGERPVLEDLRRQYALQATAQPRKSAEREGIHNLRWLWFRRALGDPAQEDSWEKGVLDDLTFPVGCTEEELTGRMETLLHKWFKRARRSVTDRQWAAFAGRDILHKGKKRSGLVSGNALRRLGEPGGGPVEEEGRKRFWQKNFLLRLGQGQTREQVLREYVENCFGVSMFPPSETAAAEKALCTGNHKNCRLHFTKGVLPTGHVSKETAWERDMFQRQREKNRAYYQARLVQNQHILSQLAQQLQNTILLQSDVTDSRTRAGNLQPRLAWRAGALQDGRVFVQRQQSELGDLSVDILLDASASQNQQQEKLSTQAYLIAAALTRCQIPVRVSSFCSVSGCTVIRIFRDYQEAGKNDAIFDYVSAGWNRDGLALRAMDWLMEREQSDHRLLILLSCASSPAATGSCPTPGRSTARSSCASPPSAGSPTRWASSFRAASRPCRNKKQLDGPVVRQAVLLCLRLCRPDLQGLPLVQEGGEQPGHRRLRLVLGLGEEAGLKGLLLHHALLIGLKAVIVLNGDGVEDTAGLVKDLQAVRIDFVGEDLGGWKGDGHLFAGHLHPGLAQVHTGGDDPAV